MWRIVSRILLWAIGTALTDRHCGLDIRVFASGLLTLDSIVSGGLFNPKRTAAATHLSSQLMAEI